MLERARQKLAKKKTQLPSWHGRLFSHQSFKFSKLLLRDKPFAALGAKRKREALLSARRAYEPAFLDEEVWRAAQARKFE